MKKVFIKTYGCQMNEYDSSRMMDLLRKTYNAVITDSPQDADLLLLNTCSIREKAQEKVFSELGRWRMLKEKNPTLIIGVAGCVASQEGELIHRRASYVDLIFGPQTFHRLPQMIQSLTAKRDKCVVDVSFPEIEKFDNLPKPHADSATAYVSIMEGCSKYCSYCIVPYTRGEEIHRPFDDILEEVVTLTEQGVKEVMLLGQNVNAYKSNLYDNTPADLALLITYIAEIEGIERIRFTTSHPLEFSDRLIQAYAQTPKLANHIHLPVQCGSDYILQAMKRGHTILEFKSKIKKLRQIRPDITISSDFIVGFPGETEADFQATLDLIKNVGFDQSFSFIFSARPGTPAATIKDNCSLEIKKQRLKILQNCLNQQALKISANMKGKTFTVLVTSKSTKNVNILSGRTENNRVVNFKGPQNWIGKMIPVQITEVYNNKLRGETLL